MSFVVDEDEVAVMEESSVMASKRYLLCMMILHLTSLLSNGISSGVSGSYVCKLHVVRTPDSSSMIDNGEPSD